MELHENEWVTSYSSGIWRIYKMLDYKGIDPATKLEVDKTTIFSKRFVSNSFKRSFKEECCDPVFVDKLDHETMAKLEHFIEQNQALYKEFQEYVPKPLNSIYNARIGIPKDKDVSYLEAIISKDKKLRVSEINQYLKELGFNTNSLPSWTAQFVSKDFECKDGYLIYSFHQILKH